MGLPKRLSIVIRKNESGAIKMGGNANPSLTFDTPNFDGSRIDAFLAPMKYGTRLVMVLKEERE